MNNIETYIYINILSILFIYKTARCDYLYYVRNNYIYILFILHNYVFFSLNRIYNLLYKSVKKCMGKFFEF